MAPISGLNGLFSLDGGTAAVPTCRRFSINPTNSPATGSASNSGGAEFNYPGVSDFTMTADLYTESGLALCVPGTAYQFNGQTSTNALADGGEVQGGVICESLSVSCDIEGGGILSATATFASIGSSTAVYTANNNALLYQAATALTNSTVPDINSALGCKAAWQLVGEAGYTDIPNVRGWNFTIACANRKYSSSSTGGVTKRVKGRKSAPTMSVQLYEGALANYATAATDYRAGKVGSLKLYTSSTLFWLFTYGVIQASPVNVDIEGDSMVNNQIDFKWSSFANISGTHTRGVITDPNSASFFS